MSRIVSSSANAKFSNYISQGVIVQSSIYNRRMRLSFFWDSFILCHINYGSLTNFHIIFIFFNSLFIWHIIFIIIFISYLFAKLIKCQPFLKSGVQVFDLLPKHVCMQHKFLHGKRCAVDQVQEAHPIFTCQICVEPMFSNQKFN